MDLANEVLEAINIAEGGEGMEVDERGAPEGEVEKALDRDDDFQDLTDEESGVKGAIIADLGVVDEIAGEEERKEEGEVEKGAGEGEVGKKNGTKKKPFKAGTTGVGGTTKMRKMQNMLAQGKRTGVKNSSRQEEGSTQMEEKGSLNPKSSTTK